MKLEACPSPRPPTPTHSPAHTHSIASTLGLKTPHITLSHTGGQIKARDCHDVGEDMRIRLQRPPGDSGRPPRGNAAPPLLPSRPPRSQEAETPVTQTQTTSQHKPGITAAQAGNAAEEGSKGSTCPACLAFAAHWHSRVHGLHLPGCTMRARPMLASLSQHLWEALLNGILAAKPPSHWTLAIVCWPPHDD